MLQNWVGGMMGRGQFVPHAIADRGNPWSDGQPDPTRTLQSRHEVNSVAEGLVAGTLVATELGWQPVEELQTGDRVVTFDSGMRPLKSVRIATLFTTAGETPNSLWPLRLPARALGNRTEMLILGNQAVLIESDAAEELYGDPFTVVPAGVLEGYKGITRSAPEREITLVTLEFEGDEVIYANGTLLVQCRARPHEQDMTREIVVEVANHTGYACLTEAQGRLLVAAMHAEG